MRGSVALRRAKPEFSAGGEMQYVFIIHEVASYAAWKVVFDDAEGIRRDAGEISYQLLHFDNDKNTIVHFSQWSSLGNAKNFFESPSLEALRQAAGVKAPAFIYLNEIEHRTL